jgi:hypothetical protein
MSDSPTDDRLLSDGDGLPVGPCPACEREVVAYLADVAGDDDVWACVHCDGPVRAVALRSEESLGDLGYSVDDPLAAGCGTGCAAGGCSAKPRATIDDLLAKHRRL